MTATSAGSTAEPFFLKNGSGQRFCLFHRPLGACRGAVLYVHPFAEELNRSRRMAALQARQLAALGYGVLQIDLYGCGDSSGDFGDARWQLWKDDLDAGAAWLHAQLGQPLTLWGLRLGATLALDYARTAGTPVQRMILWQPVLSPATYLTQFLRLRMASALLTDTASEQSGTSALRASLRRGETLEIGGYQLAPEMAAALDALEVFDGAPPACPVHWLETINASGQGVPAAAARVQAEWQRQGAQLTIHAVPCPPFWATPEITVCPAWLDATSAAMQASR
ncbi:MAG: hydrolase 2, exosortase system-associated [Massilia sp.]|nr:hydrolase 2, exosortase system-associated [Massilia sp.]